MTENFISIDPLVDGSGLTTNPEIKLRRKRVLSKSGQIAPGRPVKIAEFVNACRFLAGDTDKPFPLSLAHSNILSLIRNGHDVPENYESAINNNIDIVTKAAMLKPAEVKSKYFTANYITGNKKTEPKTGSFIDRLENWSKRTATNPISSNNIICTNNLKKEKTEMTRKQRIVYDEQTKKDFLQYLHYRIGEASMPEVSAKVKCDFIQNVNRYTRNYFTGCSRSLRDIMDSNKDIMKQILEIKETKRASGTLPGAKSTKVRTKATINTYAKKDAIETLKQVEAITANADSNITTTVKTPTCRLLPGQNYVIIDLIKALKNSGITEITLKF